jgi:uncharacterized protein YjbI with pentapeptide repeats
MQKYIVIVLLLLAWDLPAQNCPYSDVQFTQEKLNNLLAQLLPEHKNWVNESKDLEKQGDAINYNDPRRINLCGVNVAGLDLSRLNLSMVNLMGANLQGTNLGSINLSRAWLDNANLQHAQMRKANLTKTFLYHAVLNDTDLFRANLTEAEANEAYFINAILKEADLTKAILDKADLTQANLFYAILSDSDFSNVNLSQSTFFPKTNAYPDLLTLAPTFHHRAKFFQDVKFYDKNVGSPALASLRTAYQKAGMRETERILTHLLQIQAQERNWNEGGLERIGSILSYILFDLTTGYGLYPLRPLSLLIYSIFIFGLVYWFGLRLDPKHNYFEVIWESNVCTSNGRRGVKKGGHGLDTYHALRFHRRTSSVYSQLKFELKMLRISLYFSILSAFHIGWKQYNIGVWIKQLQSREFSLRVRKGWMRSVSGIQSLVSAYLLVIWILTQFSRPFG